MIRKVSDAKSDKDMTSRIEPNDLEKGGKWIGKY